MKGALVGAGVVSQYQLQAWEQIPEVEIVAIADLDRGRAQQRADVHRIEHVYQSFDTLLAEHGDLDFVDIATPPQTHLQLVNQAAEKGLHITCQKPFAINVEEARQMIAVAEQAGVVLNINENWRWRRWFRGIKALLDDNVIGHPVYYRVFAHATFLIGALARQESRLPPGNHRFSDWPYMVLFEWGVHHVDVIRYLFGEPETVYARLASTVPEITGEERALVVYVLGDLTAMLDLSWSSYDPYGMSRRENQVVEDVRIEGDKGTIALVPHPRKGDLLRVTTADGTEERPAYDGDPFAAYLQSYIDAQQHFVTCLRIGQTPVTHAHDNYNTLAATLAAYHAAEINQVVGIADFKRTH